MTLTVKEKILRLEVPVNYMLAMQIIQSANYLSRVETTRRSGESPSCSQVREEFSASDELQQHVHPGLVPAAPQPEKTIID